MTKADTLLCTEYLDNMSIKEVGTYYDLNSAPHSDDDLHSVERVFEPFSQPYALNEVQ